MLLDKKFLKIVSSQSKNKFSDKFFKQKIILINFYRHRVKRSNNGLPFDLYIEFLVVTDESVFEQHKIFAGTTDPILVTLYMKAYYAHLLNGVRRRLSFDNLLYFFYLSVIIKVNRRFQNSLNSDADLRITVKLTNYLFLTVI